MSESKSHKRAKGRAPGQKEVPMSGNRRLDSASPKTATEVERSGTPAGLNAAESRLKASHRPRKVLQVPNPDMDLAVVAMRKVGVKGSVKNMGGTKRRQVK